MKAQTLVASFVFVAATSCVAVDPDDPNAEQSQPTDPLHLLTTGTPTVQAVSGEVGIVNNMLTRLPLAGESWDVGNMHSTTVNTNRLVAPVDGIYQVSATISWRANANGTQRYVTIRSPGSSDLALSQVSPVKSSTNFTTQVVSAHIKLTAGQIIEAYVLQDSGGPLNVVLGSHVDVTWIAAGI